MPDAAGAEALRALEESLWRAETRFDRGFMDALLAPEFLEFGRSGRTYDREAILALPTGEIRARLPLRDFAVHRLADDVALVTYVSEIGDGNAELANRASVWIRRDGRWRLRFHQGTPRPAAPAEHLG